MIIKDKINKEILESPFAKAVVDIERELISLGCDLHIDCAEELIKDGSKDPDLWGLNIYPDWRIDFISLINIRPNRDNRSMEIKNEEIRRKIEEIVKKFSPN
jgi:hypothetical protein